jgi:hypothetical protein
MIWMLGVILIIQAVLKMNRLIEKYETEYGVLIELTRSQHSCEKCQNYFDQVDLDEIGLEVVK